MQAHIISSSDNSHGPSLDAVWPFGLCEWACQRGRSRRGGGAASRCCSRDRRESRSDVILIDVFLESGEKY